MTSSDPRARAWRRFHAVVVAALASLLLTGTAFAAPKVLRYAFEIAETGFDPAKISDQYSRTITPHIYEGLYEYDHLARPVKVRPLTADGMPEVSADFRVWTVHLKHGIYFADDPAFQGRKRELVAQDYVYSFKRFADPANKSPTWTDLEPMGLIGLDTLRATAVDTKTPFSYDKPIEGVRAIDRYTVRFTLAEPQPRFLETLATGELFGAVAREVIEHYGEQSDEHPVGTGPFKLVQWRRSSFIALDRNPEFREMFYDAEPAADDAEGQALLARLKGRRLPMVDRVEVSIVNEDQPRWLSFLGGEADLVYRLGFQFVNQAMPGGKVAPNLAKRGIQGYRVRESASNAMFFNMDDPTVGGYGAPQVALRRAIGLGMDVPTMIAYAYNGLAEPAQSALLPLTTGSDPRYKSEFGDYDAAKANALLDLYGYRDVNGDGWREMPDGAPLLLRFSTQADQRSRMISEVIDRSMKALHLRSQMVVAQWPENLKGARAGRLQIWALGNSADRPDGIDSMSRYDSRQIGGQNMARAKLPGMDELYDRLKSMPDGPDRQALFDQMQKVGIAYMPYKFMLNRLSIDMAQPWVIGYRHPPFWCGWWQFVDIDEAVGAKRVGG